MTHTLRTIAETAERLRISEDMLRGLVRDGEMRFVNVGRGKIKPRIMFTDRDIDDFIAARQRRLACPSTSRKARRTTGTSSNVVVTGFAALRARQPGFRVRAVRAPE